MNRIQGLLIQAFTLLLFLVYQPVSGQTVKGYIFPEKQAVPSYIYEEAKGRFTPTRQEIVQVEAIITRELKKMNDSLGVQFRDIGTIYHHLDAYLRQYVGFIDPLGNKVIWVNFVRAERRHEERLEKFAIEVSDGGANYWNVKVDLTENNTFGLRVNGRG
ncbi:MULTISPECIES: hypothetical protein [unclassified Chitinophaga]|uniref:hypothetical protein n=1 Tax=unclassified Chitinophaga TaxID=2619133 RepID=UPI00301000D5